MGEYLWLWICAILSVVLYVPLYFCLRGNIRVDPNKWTSITFHRDVTDVNKYIVRGNSTQKEAIKMLGYPLAYTVVILPMSVGRWLLYAHVENSYDGTTNLTIKKYSMLILAGACMFGLSGVINVLLFLFTRPKLLGLNQETAPTSSFPATVINIRQSHVMHTHTDQRSVEGLNMAKYMYYTETRVGMGPVRSADLRAYESEWYELPQKSSGLS